MTSQLNEDDNAVILGHLQRVRPGKITLLFDLTSRRPVLHQRPISDDMRFVSGAPWQHSGRRAKLQRGRKTWHRKDLSDANQQVGFREVLVKLRRITSPYLANEHRRKAPTWGPPRIPECM